jgi:hypothetical protein
MATQTSIEIPRPESGDVVEMIPEGYETLLHHLDEEERDILNPAREDVTEADRAGRALVDHA